MSTSPIRPAVLETLSADTTSQSLDSARVEIDSEEPETNGHPLRLKTTDD